MDISLEYHFDDIIYSYEIEIEEQDCIDFLEAEYGITDTKDVNFALSLIKVFGMESFYNMKKFRDFLHNKYESDAEKDYEWSVYNNRPDVKQHDDAFNLGLGGGEEK